MRLQSILSAATVAIVAVATLSSCSDKKWKAEGTVAGGEGKELVLEAPNGRGGWYATDTISVDRHGKFTVKGVPAGHPEVYRLTLGGESLYFPIDSLEAVTITADASHFGNNYTVAGSESAEKMQEINDLIAKVVKTDGEQAVAYDPTLKRALAEAILRDPAGIVAYYTIFRKVGNTQLFDTSSRSDLKLIGAVANAYAQHRPNDPRTEFLTNLYISNHKKLSVNTAPTDTIMAQIIHVPEISLLDAQGKTRSLTAEASKGKVMVVNFTAYSAEGSPALNVELARIYNAHKSQGFEIYQVSVDDDEFFWKKAAKNLPWITVYNSPKSGAENLLRYNVSAIPATFIINRNGELVERIDDITRLESAVQRYL